MATEKEIIDNGDPVACPNCNGINDRADRACWNCGCRVSS